MISPTSYANAFFFGFDGSVGVALREAGVYLYPESITEDMLSEELVTLLITAPQAAFALLDSRIDVLETWQSATVDPHIANTANPHSVTKAQVGLGNVDNTADADKPVSSATVTYVGNMVSVHAASTATHGATGAVVGTTNTQTLTNKTLTAPAITSPTGIVKGDVGLGNVDNTSDVNKPVSTAQAAANTAHAGATTGIHGVGAGAVVGTTLTQTLSGKTISGASNTLTNLPGANVTGTVPIGSLPTGATASTLATGDRGMPTGGATGDVLTKSSGTNYAVGWVTKPTTPAPVYTANATAAVYSSVGTVTLATSTITLPVGVWLVRGDGWFHGEGTSGTTGGFTLGMSVNGSVQTSQNQLFEQGVDGMYHFANAALVTGTGAAITVTFQMAWVSGNVQRYNAELMITATPA